MEDRPFIPPYLALTLGVFAVSTAAIFIRFAQQYAPSLVIAAYRLNLAVLLLAPWVLYHNREELKRLHARQLWLALLSGVFLALHFATWIQSLEYTTVASSVVLVTTTPLWVALISPFTLREPLTRNAAIGMGLALLGGIGIGLSDACIWQNGVFACPSFQDALQGSAVYGDLLAVIGAMMAALYLTIGRSLRSKVSLGSYIFVVYGAAAVVLLLFTVTTGIFITGPSHGSGEYLFGYPPQTYLWFALLALVPQLLGHTSFNWALRYLSAAFVSISLLGEPIGSTLLAYIFLNETPSLFKVFGAILILAGIYTASRSEKSAPAVPA